MVKKLHILLFILVTTWAVSYANHDYNLGNLQENSLSIYPNPVTDNNFTVTSEMEITEISILNVLGQQVFQQKVLNQKKINIELGTTEKGMYLLQIKTSDKQVITKRILFK